MDMDTIHIEFVLRMTSASHYRDVERVDSLDLCDRTTAESRVTASVVCWVWKNDRERKGGSGVAIALLPSCTRLNLRAKNAILLSCQPNVQASLHIRLA